MTQPCFRCGQMIDELGLVEGRCHGCRVEYATMRRLRRHAEFPSKGRNRKARPLIPFHPIRLPHPGLPRHSLYRGLHVNPNSHSLHPSEEVVEMARKTIENAIGSYEDIPLGTLDRK